MASNSGRKSGSSGRSSSRKRVVIGAEETTRVRYSRDKPEVESERRKTTRQSKRDSSQRAPEKKTKASAAGRRMANEKRDERDKRKRSIARRRAALGLAITLSVAAVMWGLVSLWNAPLLPVRSVEVTGVSRLTTESVLASAAIPAGATLPRLPKRQILDRIRANPWVAKAELQRSLPGIVRILIVERTPVAFVHAGGADTWLMSADGFWLSRRSKEDTTPVPTIREAPGAVPLAGKQTGSKELRNALEVVEGLSPELRGRVKTVSAPTIDKTALTLSDGIQVFVGSAEDIDKKDQLVRQILAKEKKLVYINVRVVQRPTWRGLNAGD